MRKLKYYAVALMLAASLTSCGNDYDDSELKKGLTDLTTRVEKLETWCNTANGQISALQGLVSALENKDYVTGVTPIMEGTKEVGYTITFAKSKPITLMNGKDGVDGNAPVIGVKQDTDGLYYWTVKTGDAEAAWMTDAEGNKIRTTGDKGTDGEDGTPGVAGADGHSPVLSVADDGGKLYWKVDGEWLLNNGSKVPATGDKGETGATGSQGPAGSSGTNVISAVDTTTNPENVIFTLAGGTKITLPRTNGISIGFESYEPFYCSPDDCDVTIVLPSDLKETDYTSLVATISNEVGSNMDIQSRAIAENVEGKWGVSLTKPTFTNGVIQPKSAKVTLVLPQNKTYYKALLKVTLIDMKGKEHSVSRIVWFKADKDTNVVNSTEGNLSAAISDGSTVKQLSIVGTMNADDFQYIRENMSALEVLDLSRTTITELPFRAMAFYGSMGLSDNTALRTVILPETLTTIGNSAFAMCTNLQEINLPARVRTLGKWMFEGCNQLANVTLPSGITDISENAFYGCGIKSIEIPSSVTSIGAWAFSECKQLVSANIPSGVTILNDGVFYMCDNFQNITWHDNITAIGSDVFCICEKFATKNLVLPKKVTTIGARAFSWTGVTSVKFPEGLTTIGQSAFNQCPIENIDLPSTLISLGAVSFTWKNAVTVTCRSTTPPTINEYDDSNNKFPPFHEINPSTCKLKRPAGADYSSWDSYFGGGISDI